MNNDNVAAINKNFDLAFRSIRELRDQIKTNVPPRMSRADEFKNVLATIDFKEDGGARRLFEILHEEMGMADNETALIEIKQSIDKHRELTMKESFGAIHDRINRLEAHIDGAFDGMVNGRLEAIEDDIENIVIPSAPPPKVVYQKTSEGQPSAFIAGLFVGAILILGFNQFNGISTVQQVVDRLIEIGKGIL